jgi:Sel1 repeat
MTATRYLVCCLLMCVTARVATADTAAGRTAFEQGDYVRAMTEWQQAADRGDAAAEFGLGQLYEFGVGDLPQNYKRADYWYRKAARGGQSEAEYRLALIWSAGSADFPPHLVEAYQWVVLAADSKGVWGSLASDLKTQLESMTTPEQQAQGRKRAVEWNATGASPPQAPPAASAVVPNQTVAVAPMPVPGAPAAVPSSGTPAATAKSSGGCPGWPFPTLPCTVQFPALPGAALPKPPPKPSVTPEPAEPH